MGMHFNGNVEGVDEGLHLFHHLEGVKDTEGVTEAKPLRS